MKLCPGCSTAVVLLLAAVLALHAAVAHAGPAHGSYVGCFAISDTSTGVTKAKKLDDLNDCAPSCHDQNYPLAMISTDAKSTDYMCMCGSVVPDEKLKLDDKDCEPGKSGVAVFYKNSNYAGYTQCRVMNMPMEKFVAIYGADHCTVDNATDTLKVELKRSTGARLESEDSYRYGMFQIVAKPCGASGVVSSFYSRSSRIYPNTKLTDFSEIDWEWCNGRPCDPGTIHTNSFTKAQSNGETKFAPDEYQKILGSAVRSDTTFITYTIDWQSDSLTWYLNGQVLKTLKNGDWVQLPEWEGGIKKRFVSPNLPCHQVISMWTDDRDVPPIAKFGGPLDASKAPFYSYFKQMRRVVCDRPMPCSTEQAAAALGPAWLYGGSSNTAKLVAELNSTSTIQCADVAPIVPEDDLKPSNATQNSTGGDNSSVVAGPGWLPDLSVYPVGDLEYLAANDLKGAMNDPNAAGGIAAGMYHMLLAAVAGLMLSMLLL